jgi:molecular chaperone Hsp33
MNADSIIHAMACNNMVRCVAAVTTNLVGEATQRHKTSPTASAALGRSLTAGLLLGTMLKDVERLALIFDCTGPVKRITVDADPHGNVRGYVQNPSVDLPLNGHNKFDVGGLVGGGMLYVVREGGFYEMGVYQDAYRGSVPIMSGEIAEDVAHYLTKSEQIPSAVSLGVRLVPNEATGFVVESAGGFLVQILPGASDDIVASLEETIRALPMVTTMIRQGRGPQEIIRDALGQYDFTVLEERAVQFKCTCSYTRAVKIVSAIEPGELQTMLMEDGGAEMVCHYCSSTYNITRETLAQIIAGEKHAMRESGQG